MQPVRRQHTRNTRVGPHSFQLISASFFIRIPCSDQFSQLFFCSSITGKRLTCQRLHDLVWEESIFDTMLLDPQQIVSILAAKPDIVRRNLAKLMKRIAQEGFSLVAARLTMLTPLDAAMVTPDEDREVSCVEKEDEQIDNCILRIVVYI